MEIKIRNVHAENGYRSAWAGWCVSSGAKKKEYEVIMDGLQPLIADSPKDPRWRAFVNTLPGYREVWNGMLIDGLRKAKAMFGGF